MDLSLIYIRRILFNYLGGTIRFIFGTFWRTLFNKPKFTYKEYVYGLQTEDISEKAKHKFNNRVIGAIFICIVVYILANSQ